jgi:ABC transporter family protein
MWATGSDITGKLPWELMRRTSSGSPSSTAWVLRMSVGDRPGPEGGADACGRHPVAVAAGLGAIFRERSSRSRWERSAPAARSCALSGGERQRFALCADLAHQPALLLADEPTGELDGASADAVRALIVELARVSPPASWR